MKKNWLKIIAVVVFLAGFGLILGRNLPGILSAKAPDFTQVWMSAKALTVSREPYLDAGLDYPNAYPPVSELFFLPLAFLTYHQALTIFTYISFVAIIGSIFLALKIAIKKVPWHYFLLFSGMTLLSFPTKFSLGMGQINMIVLFLLLLAVYLETKPKKNSIAAGISMGIAIALKPIFAFFLLFLALKKSWKAILVSALTVGILIMVTLLIWSPHIWISWYQSGVLPLIDYTSPQIYVYPNQGVFGFLYRIIADSNTRIYLHKAATIFLIPLAAYLVFKNKDVNLGISFFIITLLLFDLTSWQHHFVWLMFPFIVLLFNIIKSKNIPFFILVVLSFLLVSWNFRNPFPYPVLLWSTQFYGALILWGINLYFLTSHKTKAVKRETGSIRDNFFDSLAP